MPGCRGSTCHVTRLDGYFACIIPRVFSISVESRVPSRVRSDDVRDHIPCEASTGVAEVETCAQRDWVRYSFLVGENIPECGSSTLRYHHVLIGVSGSSRCGSRT